MKSKKDKLKYLLILIILSLSVVGSIGVIKALSSNEQKNEPVKNEIAKYEIKYAYNEREDGWFDTFKITFIEGENNRYYFNGVNLKYEKLDGYYVPVVDKKTKEIVDKVYNVIPTLSISEEYGEEVRLINEFFNENQFKNKITVENLNDLKISKIKKDYITNLFNKAITNDGITEEGKYINHNVYERIEEVSTDENLNGKYILTYTLDNGYISNVYFDFQYDDGQYMSSQASLYTNNNLKKIYVSIEKDIIDKYNNRKIETDRIDISTSNDNIKKDLKNLLEKMNATLE